jgi:hypothetical protein
MKNERDKRHNRQNLLLCTAEAGATLVCMKLYRELTKRNRLTGTDAQRSAREA